MRDEQSRNGRRRRKPATTPEERENQLIAGAMTLAESQIEEGSVSAQVLTHFLRLGTEKYKLEREKLEADTRLSIAKVEATEISKRLEEKYDQALEALRSYTGHVDDGDDYVGEDL